MGTLENIKKPTNKNNRYNKMDTEFIPERRSGKDRRQNVVDRRLGPECPRGPGIRLTKERKAAEEGQMSDEQFEFLMAIDEYKRKNQRPFPTWTEVLEMIKALGYCKVDKPEPPEPSGKKTEPVKVPLGTWLD